MKLPATSGLGLAVLLAVIGCGGEGRPAADRQTEVAVELATPVAQVDPRFLSVAIDSGHVAGGELWCPGGDTPDDPCDAPPYDFGRARLRRLASELAPGYVRVGGTQADTAYVDLSADPAPTPPEGYRWVLTAERWDAIHDFSAATGLELMFTLNAGPGPRDAEGNWVPDQARALMERSIAQGQDVPVWELGNEPDGYVANFGVAFADTVTGAQHAASFATLAALRDELLPASKVVGPATAWWPVVGEFGTQLYPAFMSAGGGQTVDAITWHYYPQQSDGCPVATRRAEPDLLLEPDHLAEFDMWAAEVEGEVAEHAVGTPVWLGEVGNAQCGGQDGISDRFASSLWWVDQLGRMARRGQPVAVRQTLSGLHYGLIDDETLQPAPDYWTSVLWKRLMGSTVLEARATDDPRLVAYAHCTASSAPGHTAGAVTLAIVNLDPDRSVDVELGDLGGGRTVWRLSGPELASPDVHLNGTRLQAGEDGTLPELPGEPVSGPVRLDPITLAYVVIADAGAPACP